MSTPLILVCDDTPAKRYVLSSWLRRGGFEVVESETASEAENLLRTEDVDLAILDVHLPDASGLDVTRTIRADPGLASTPVIHVSGIARETSDKVVALDEGADAYLVDPIEPEELLSTVRALLRSSGARREAEQLATRLARLSRAAVRLNVSGSVPRLVESASRAAAEVLGTPAAALLLDGEGEAWRASASGRVGNTATGVPSEVARALVDELAPGAAPLPLGPPWAGHLPVAAGRWTGCPVRVDGRAEGVVAAPLAPGDEERSGLLLERLAQAVTVALENLRALEFEHRTAVTLQRSLLPSVLPEPPGLAIAARYRASQQRMEVGGDFFDAFLVGGHCWLVIGDVQGHSLEAAVVMAELRYSLRAYAHEGHGPAAALARVDDLLERTDPDLTATASIVVVTPDRRSAEVVSAGHPPPLHVRRGEVARVPVEGMLLGLGVGVADRPPTRVELESGDRLLLYTDGLVERRRLPLEVTADHLVHQVSGSSWASADELADELLRTWSGSEDDIALLVADLLP